MYMLQCNYVYIYIIIFLYNIHAPDILYIVSIKYMLYVCGYEVYGKLHTLRVISLHYIGFHYIILHYSTLCDYITVHYITVRYVTVHDHT